MILAEPKFLKAFADAGARAVQQLVKQWRPKKKIRVGIMSVLQGHGRAGNPNPHLHLVACLRLPARRAQAGVTHRQVSEGGVDKHGQWQPVTYFDTKKLRRLWQYQVLTALKKAVRAAPYGRGVVGEAGADVHVVPERLRLPRDARERPGGAAGDLPVQVREQPAYLRRARRGRQADLDSTDRELRRRTGEVSL